MVRDDLTGKFEREGYLTEATVTEGSPPVGQTVADALADIGFHVDLVQLIREGQTFVEPLGPKEIRTGDILAPGRRDARLRQLSRPVRRHGARPAARSGVHPQAYGPHRIAGR